MKTALLIVDAQVNMWEGPLHRGAEVLLHLAELIERARQARAPVVFVRNMGRLGEPDAVDSPGFAIHPSLSPAQGEVVVDKSTNNALASTPLGSILRSEGVSHVVIAGMQSELCIDATCRGAIAQGFSVTLARGAHSTFDGKMVAAAQIELVERSLAPLAEVADWSAIPFTEVRSRT